MDDLFAPTDGAVPWTPQPQVAVARDEKKKPVPAKWLNPDLPWTKPPFYLPTMAEIDAVPLNGLTVVSTFSGCGGGCLGFKMAGYTVLWASEFIPAAQETYRANHPGTLLDTRDIRQIEPDEILAAIGMARGEIDVLEGSPPCFGAGTQVITDRGTVAIEDVRIGDRVLTHRSRWRRVTATMSREAPTLTLGITAITPEHRIFSRRQERQRGASFSLAEPEWRAASAMVGHFYGVPAVASPLAIPPLRIARPLLQMPEFWWLVGRWLGDGWVRWQPNDEALPWRSRTRLSPIPRDCPVCGQLACRSRRYPHLFGLYCTLGCKRKALRAARRRPRFAVLFACAPEEAEKLGEQIRLLGWPGRIIRSRRNTAVKFSLGSRPLAEWLVGSFGRGAAGKTLPGWLFGAPEMVRRAVFDGYISADGHSIRTGMSAGSISRSLSVGMRVLATTLGYTTSRIRFRAPRPDSRICGRRVNARGSYTFTAHVDDGRYTRLDGGTRWSKMRARWVRPGESRPVYDLTVEEDASFTADGMIVHNCASFSIAGNRDADWGKEKKYSDTVQRVDDLFDEFLRLVGGLKPKVVVAENVPGMLLGAARDYYDHILATFKTLGYVATAKILDAQWYGVPQCRRRLIFVAVRKDLGRPPVFPEENIYRYSVLDALPWLAGTGLLTGRGKTETIERPMATIQQHGNLHTRSEAGIRALPEIEPEIDAALRDAALARADAIDAGLLVVEDDAFIDGYAIGDEADKIGPGESSGKYFQLVRSRLDGPTSTVTQTGGNTGAASVIHPTEKRKFSIAELRRICGFPDDFILTGTFRQQWERLGRAVCPPVYRALAEVLADKIFR